MFPDYFHLSQSLLFFQHLGQGANQSFEDIYHFIRLLTSLNPFSDSPSSAVLEDIFTQYERVRIPRTAALVKGARKMGETRTVQGVDACKKRNAAIREMWSDKASIEETYHNLLNAPFTGESEI